MKKIVCSLIILLLTTMISCININKLKSNNLMQLSDNAFKYIGTWKVESYDVISDDEIETYDNIDNMLSKGVQISKNDISIFDSIINNVRYKLKVVDKNYVISYEYDLTIEKFMNDKDKLDIISVIDDNITLCEFAIIDDENIIMIYKSLLIYLKKVSNDVTFEVNKNNIQDENSISINETDSNVGVMIGIKTPRYLQEDGTYTEDRYRTIWISYKDNDISDIYEKEDIIFPRMNGIWKLESKVSIINEKHFDYFQVHSLDGKVTNVSPIDENKSIYKSIKFIGNDYIAVESYIGENFINEYPIYQIIPVDNINSNKGLSMEEIFNKEIKDVYENDFKKALDNIPDEDKLNYKNSIDYTSITMERYDGRWILRGKIQSKNENERGKDFTLSLEPNKKIINFNSLFIPWKILKGEAPFLIDAMTSPNGEIAIVRYKKDLVIYRLEDGHLVGSPLNSIPLGKNDEIIMTEWCSSGYVDEWQKAFNDGISLIEEDE